MKFDVVMGNPPYCGSLHLKVLKKCVSIASGQIVIVHPSAWLVKQTPCSLLEEECRGIVKKYDTSFTFIKGKYYFGVTQYTPCTITHINIANERTEDNVTIKDETNNKIWNFNSVNDINYISDDDEYFLLKTKIKAKTAKHNIASMVGTLGNYYVTIPKIRGSDNTRPNCKQGLVHNDFYTLISKKPKITKEAVENTDYIGFNTYKEAENFIVYLKTHFARFCLSILKFDANIRSSKLKNIPIVDFNKPWTDKELFDLFSLTTNQIKVINETTPSFY